MLAEKCHNSSIAAPSRMHVFFRKIDQYELQEDQQGDYGIEIESRAECIILSPHTNQ
jgi:hypothetical protein